MVIRKIVFLIVVSIIIVGCNNKSNITVQVCNASNVIMHNVTIEWKAGKYSFKTLSKGSCGKVNLFNIKSESSLIVSTNKYIYPIDVYFESKNYSGSIEIQLGENNITFQDDIAVK